MTSAGSQGDIGLGPLLAELLLVGPGYHADDLGDGVHVGSQHALLLDSCQVPVELGDSVIEADHPLIIISLRFVSCEGVHEVI